MDPFETMYAVRQSDRKPFGAKWCGPDRFGNYEETLVARYPKTGGDGQSVEVYCSAAPARFYTIKVLTGPNSVGTEQPGFVL